MVLLAASVVSLCYLTSSVLCVPKPSLVKATKEVSSTTSSVKATKEVSSSTSSARPSSTLEVSDKEILTTDKTSELSETDLESLADAVCGKSADGFPPAADTQTTAVWEKYKIADWFYNVVGQIGDDGTWDYPNSSTPIDGIQSLILYEAHEGKSKCSMTLTEPQCTGDGADYNQCRAFPEAHFVWIATVNYAYYLASIYQTLLASSVAQIADTGKMVSLFFTPRSDPSDLILPISIVSGFFAGLSGFIGPFAIVAGAGSVINGALTQAGLDQPDPLVQWQGVQSNVGNAFEDLSKAIQALYRYTLGTFPDGKNYAHDPKNLPAALASGYFCQEKKVNVIDPQIKGAVSSAGINALWIQDRVFIIKLTDAAYGQGLGSACKAWAEMTICIDGIAYIVARWSWQLDLTGMTYDNGLNPDQWYAYGAYDVGQDGNANHLPAYGLNLEDIVKSSIMSQDKYGWLFDHQLDATVAEFNKTVTALQASELWFWNLPVCDMAAVMGSGKHLGKSWEFTDPKYSIPNYAGCTCLLAKGWPLKEYPSGGGDPGEFSPMFGPNGCQSNWDDDGS